MTQRLLQETLVCHSVPEGITSLAGSAVLISKAHTELTQRLLKSRALLIS